MPGRLLVFCGIPGSGKTTIARLVTRTDPDAVHIQTDSIRAMLTAPSFDAAESDFVYRACVAVAKEALGVGRLVVLDGTFGSSKRREKTFGVLAGLYSRVDFVFVSCDLQTALERNATRTGGAAVPEDSVIGICRGFEPPDGALRVDSSKTPPQVLADEILKKLRL